MKWPYFTEIRDEVDTFMFAGAVKTCLSRNNGEGIGVKVRGLWIYNANPKLP